MFPIRNVPRQRATLGWLVIGQLALVAAWPLAAQQTPLTNASQIRGLSAAEAAQGRPVKLRGTLTAYIPEWNGLFLQDETGAAYVEHNPARDGGPTDLQPGQIVEVAGKTRTGVVHCDVVASALSIVGTGPLPLPLDLSNTNSFNVENERLRVEGTGQVLEVGAGGGRPRLQLVTPAGYYLNLFLPPGQTDEAQSLRGAAIEFEGVLGLGLTAGKWNTGQFDVYVMGMDGIHKIKSLGLAPITPIAELVADGRPARIRASVEELRTASLVARDPSGVVVVEYER